jgi:hypothetical protein
MISLCSHHARTASLVLLTAALTSAASGCMDRELVPLAPCLVSGVTDRVEVQNVDRVDLLFVVDDSESMREEQAALRAQFPKLIRVLTSGDRDDGGDTHDFTPPKDLHLGVVSTDLGLGGFDDALHSGCSDLGDDGRLLHAPSPELSACAPSYPPFLSFHSGVDDPATTAHDFACIASLGTDGCGFEQQLESMLKALWPSDDPRVTFVPDHAGFGASGQGDAVMGGRPGANAGFLRSDAVRGPSLLAVVIVTDEEDCSSRDLTHLLPDGLLDPADADQSTVLAQGRNVRCQLNQQNLYETVRYVNALRALRPGRDDLVVFAAIAGVPPDSVAEVPDDFAHDEVARARFYAGILDHPAMQPTVDTRGTDTPADDTIRPSCETSFGRAFPPRRIVQVAEGFGASGMVQSICQDDFGPAMDAIASLISKPFEAGCLPRPLVRDADGRVSCDVIWELPAAGGAPAGTPTECAASPLLSSPEAGEPPRTLDGRARCRVPQLGVSGNGPDRAPVPTVADGASFAEGWFYDDFSEQVARSCPVARRQRIGWSQAARPPSGVTVKLECWNEQQRLPERREGLALAPQPAIGDACRDVERAGGVVTGDLACVVELANGELDATMFCHPELNVCVRSCSSDADCPAAWVCDDRSERAGVAAGARPFCVSPTCSAGL